MELEEKEAKSNAKIKVFEEWKQPTAALMIPILPRKNASCGKKIQADSYWGIPHRDTSLRRYITRNFRVRGPNFTNIDEMKDSNFLA